MRVFTRGDMDGMTSVILLSLVENITEIAFTHPKDMQDGKIPVTGSDIITNLPYVKGCALWFDHHSSEETGSPAASAFKGSFAIAPSTARVIHDYYKRPDFEKYNDLLNATDRLDSASLTLEDVASPSGWILLGLTLDPRSGLGAGFRDYFRHVVEYAKTMPLQNVLEQPDVKTRCERILKEQDDFKKVLLQHSRQEKNVIVTDLRGVKDIPAGNRFLIYTLYPEANAEARIFPGALGNTVVAVGQSIFNRTGKTNLGKLMAEYGGGGHEGAATCQIPNDKADATTAEIIRRLKEN